MEQGFDYHTAEAARLFGAPVEEVTREQRETTKLFTFQNLYGGKPRKLMLTNVGRKLMYQLILPGLETLFFSKRFFRKIGRWGIFTQFLPYYKQNLLEQRAN